jgi:hypothetical protein
MGSGTKTIPHHFLIAPKLLNSLNIFILKGAQGKALGFIYNLHVLTPVKNIF